MTSAMMWFCVAMVCVQLLTVVAGCPPNCDSCFLNRKTKTSWCAVDGCISPAVYNRNDGQCVDCPSNCESCYFNRITKTSWCTADGCTDGSAFIADKGQCAVVKRDCVDIKNGGISSNGVYTIHIGPNQRAVQVYCDMTTSNGGWTVFQRRQDGSVDFYRGWTDYANGFGQVSGEFWLGNDNLYDLTENNGKQYVLRIDMTKFDGTKWYAEYNNFKIDAASNSYTLSSIGTYSGNARDSMTYHVGQKFSTLDRDNDKLDGNCAVLVQGAWWYKDCYYANLNSKYSNQRDESKIQWNNDPGSPTRKFVEMKIKPV